MTNLLKHKRAVSLLGLSFETGRVEGAVVRKSNSGIDSTKPFSASLTGELAKDDSQVLGAELRKLLEAEGINERACVVGLPSEWVLAFQSQMPDLPGEDLSNFLDLEAERGFAYSPEELIICRSSFVSPAGVTHVTQVAVPREKVEHMEQLLRAARLSPVSFTLSLCALQGPSGSKSQGMTNLLLTPTCVGMLAQSEGGIAMFRTLQVPREESAAAPRISVDAVIRELRITLGQLAADVRATLKGLRIVGGGAEGDRLAEGLRARAASWNLTVERDELKPAFGLERGVSPVGPMSPATLLAARNISGLPAELEFLPPRLSAWKNLSARYATKKFVYAGAAASAIAVVVAGLFLYQQYQLSHLRSQWLGMKSRVQGVEEMQTEIKRFRPWYDGSLRSLSILRSLTQAFPEDSTITAKTLEIREGGLVVCAGTARDHAALLKTLDRLRATKEIVDVQVDQLRGKSPLQFTFNFRWAGGSDKL